MRNRLAKNVSFVVLSLAGTLCVTGAANAQTEIPKFWTLGPRADGVDPDINGWVIPIVQINTGALTGTEAADAVFAAVDARGLESDQIAVYLHDFGKGVRLAYNTADLVLHPDDALADPDPCTPESIDDLLAHTPWSYYGIFETYLWTIDFIAEYQILANNCSSLYPSRFCFDTEFNVWPTDCCSSDWVALFDLMQLDTRWDNMNVPGTGDTLANLWAEVSGEIDYFPNLPVNDEDNQDFVQWLTGIYMTAEDGAMNQATYGALRTWFGALTSNYKVSCRLEAPYGWSGTQGIATVATWVGSADFQAPDLYPGDGVDPLRSRMNMLLNSFPGSAPHDQEITPWVWMPGEVITTVHGPYFYSATAARQDLAMLRSMKCPEINFFLGYQHDDPLAPDTWAMLYTLLDEIWHTSIDDAVIVEGTQVGIADFPDEMIKYALPGSVLEIEAEEGTFDVDPTVVEDPETVAMTSIEVTFNVDFDVTPDNLAVVITTTQVGGSMNEVKMRASFWDWTNDEWVPATGDFYMPEIESNVWRCIENASTYISGGQVKVQIVQWGDDNLEFTSNYSSVQLVGDSDVLVEFPANMDFDEDGIIGLSDWMYIYDNFGTVPPKPADADLDEDGDVDWVDIAILQQHFGQFAAACW